MRYQTLERCFCHIHLSTASRVLVGLNKMKSADFLISVLTTVLVRDEQIIETKPIIFWCLVEIKTRSLLLSAERFNEPMYSNWEYQANIRFCGDHREMLERQRKPPTTLNGSIGRIQIGSAEGV